MDPDPTADRRPEQLAALEAALFPLVARALETRRGSPELVTWAVIELSREGGSDPATGGVRAAVRRVAGRLAALVADSGFAGPLHERLFLTIRAQQKPAE